MQYPVGNNNPVGYILYVPYLYPVGYVVYPVGISCGENGPVEYPVHRISCGEQPPQDIHTGYMLTTHRVCSTVYLNILWVISCRLHI